MINLNWRKYLLVWAILLTSLIANNSYAEDYIVFSDIGKVYSSLYQLEMCEEEKILKTDKIVLLESNISILERENKLYEEQIDLLKRKEVAILEVSSAQDSAIKNMVGIIELQKKSYEEYIKDTKPSFFERLKEGALFIGTGIIIGVLII